MFYYFYLIPNTEPEEISTYVAFKYIVPKNNFSLPAAKNKFKQDFKNVQKNIDCKLVFSSVIEYEHYLGKHLSLIGREGKIYKLDVHITSEKFTKILRNFKYNYLTNGAQYINNIEHMCFYGCIKLNSIGQQIKLQFLGYPCRDFVPWKEVHSLRLYMLQFGFANISGEIKKKIYRYITKCTNNIESMILEKPVILKTLLNMKSWHEIMEQAYHSRLYNQQWPHQKQNEKS